MTLTELSSFFKKYKTQELQGRYITPEKIHPLLLKMATDFELKVLGESENKVPIHGIKLGTGAKRLLFWSQMHGNESTTTKALFDFINTLLDTTNTYSQEILSQCTLYMIPMLNPDGANLYTRLNYNTVDLNRDAQDLSQRESVILHDLIAQLKPDVAFNLHGQRTIFSAGTTNKTATMSFLSAAGDKERSITPDRKIAMDIIQIINTYLQQVIPGQVGRYDDGFNINCVGDTLANKGIPAILFEAGHYPGDYDREITRQFVYYGLLTSVYYIATNPLDGSGYEGYFEIPENDKLFYDYIIRNAIINDKKVDVAIQYEEKLMKKSLEFIPKIAAIGDLSSFYGHKEVDALDREIVPENKMIPFEVGNKILKFSILDEVFSTELAKN